MQNTLKEQWDAGIKRLATRQSAKAKITMDQTAFTITVPEEDAIDDMFALLDDLKAVFGDSVDFRAVKSGKQCVSLTLNITDERGITHIHDPANMALFM